MSQTRRRSVGWGPGNVSQYLGAWLEEWVDVYENPDEVERHVWEHDLRYIARRLVDTDYWTRP